MLVAQIGYRLASDAATLCDPFAPSTQPTPGTHRLPGLSTPEALQTMAAHGHGHCLKANETFQNVQQEIFKVRTILPGVPEFSRKKLVVMTDVIFNLKF